MADCSPIYNPTPVETYLNRILGLPPKNARPKKIVKIDNNNTTATTTSVDDDGSAGYGSTKLDSSIYTRDTAPEKIKQKFHYYFNKFQEVYEGDGDLRIKKNMLICFLCEI